MPSAKPHRRLKNGRDERGKPAGSALFIPWTISQRLKPPAYIPIFLDYRLNKETTTTDEQDQNQKDNERRATTTSANTSATARASGSKCHL